jgi:hypothetical protein
MATVSPAIQRPGLVPRGARSRDRFVVFATPEEWQIGVLAAGKSRFIPVPTTSVAPTERSPGIAEALRSAGYAGQPVILALASTACLVATIATAGLPRRGRRQAMLYRLEEQMPVAAEELLADFILHDGSALGVSALAANLTPIIEALRGQGIDVAAVCPTAILALQSLRRQQEAEDASADEVILLQDGLRIDLFTCSDSAVVAWSSIPAHFRDLSLALSAQLAARTPAIRITAVNLDPSLSRELSEQGDFIVTHRTTMDVGEAALSSAARALSGEETPPVDLRAGEDGGYAVRHLRSPLIAAISSAALLCAVLIASLLWRAARYGSMASEAEHHKTEIFQELFPHETVPAGIESRLLAVRRQLGQVESGSAPSTADGPDAFLALRDILQNLPADVRYRITDLEIDDGRLSLQGQVRTLADADAIARALRRIPGFSIDAPQIPELGENLVRFVIVGTIQKPQDSAGRKSS